MRCVMCAYLPAELKRCCHQMNAPGTCHCVESEGGESEEKEEEEEEGRQGTRGGGGGCKFCILT